MSRISKLLPVALLTLTPSVKALSAHQYDIVDLGPIDFVSECTISLNEVGVVAGTSTDDFAFLWSAGVVERLRRLDPSGRSDACDVNDNGTVVGRSWVGGKPHAVVWHGGVVLDLGTFGGTDSTANGVNDNGHIVGHFGLSGGGTGEHAFLIGAEGFVDLGTLGGSRSTANDINESGWIAGYSRTSSGPSHAVVWVDGVAQDLGTLGAANLDSFAYAINDAGVVVGHSAIFSSNDRRAFMWSDGVMTELPNPAGSTFTIAYGINASGKIVGTGDDRALLWQGDGVHDLNSAIDPLSGWSLEAATDIDNEGRIGGYGFLNGTFRGFLLVPR